MQHKTTQQIQKQPCKSIKISNLKRKLWDKDEDELLRRSIRQHGSNWKLIAKFLPGRNPSQCVQRWKRIKPVNEFRNSRWSEAEDEQVLRLTQVHKSNWKHIANEMKTRTGRQIRERYINHLDPKIDKSIWKSKEDAKIWELYTVMGTKWSEMAKLIVGRTENMIKNRFYSFVRNQYGQIQNPYYVVPKVEQSPKEEDAIRDIVKVEESLDNNQKQEENRKDLFESIRLESSMKLQQSLEYSKMLFDTLCQYQGSQSLSDLSQYFKQSGVLQSQQL